MAGERGGDPSPHVQQVLYPECQEKNKLISKSKNLNKKYKILQKEPLGHQKNKKIKNAKIQINKVGGPDGQGQKKSWPSAQPIPDIGPEDHIPIDCEDVQDVFRMDEMMIEDWTETCSTRIICLSLVDGCISKTINKCINAEHIITTSRPTQRSHPEAAELIHPPPPKTRTKIQKSIRFSSTTPEIEKN